MYSEFIFRVSTLYRGGGGGGGGGGEEEGEVQYNFEKDALFYERTQK